MTREKIKELVWDEFVNFTGVTGAENLDLRVFSVKREIFIRRFRNLFPDLRLRNSLGKVRVSDFVDALFAESIYKEKLFNQALEKVRKITNHPEYTLDDVIYSEKNRTHLNFYFDMQPVNKALCELFGYTPPYCFLASQLTVREKCELLYRRGKF